MKTRKECKSEGFCETHDGVHPKPQHTPTPWHVAATWSQTDIVDDAQKGKGAWALVAKAFKPGDAAFIVRAVNSHEELKESLRLAANVLKDDCPEMAKRFFEAIAKAEGRE